MAENECKTNPVRLIAPCILMLAIAILAYTILQVVQPGVPPVTVTPTPALCPTSSLSPTHTLEEAKNYVARVMATYSDMMYAEVPTPTFNNCSGKWEAAVTIFRNNVTQRAHLFINDTPLLMHDGTYLEGQKLLFISEDMVVTNGTLRIGGKIACTSDCGNKTCVWEFADPYDSYSVAAENTMASFLAKHNDSIDFRYRILLTQSIVLENNYGKEDVERISKYFICAQNQSLLAPLKSCALGKYKAKGKNEPLTKDELDACLPADLNSENFSSCLDTAYIRIADDKMLAETYLGISALVTPRVVFDCQYRVHPTYLEHGFCFVHPNATGCSN